MGKKVPTWEESEPIESASNTPKKKQLKTPVWEESTPIEPEIETFEKVLNVLDIPGSLVRTGVEAAISPEKEVIPQVTEQFKAIVESPTTAAMQAPTGIEVAKTAFPDYKEKSIPGQIGGFVTEMALDPSSWFRPSRAVTKPVRKALESASERQATRAISKFANKADVLKEGVDLDVVGARLVAEDLQGQIKDPVKLYQTLSGQKHLQKIGKDLPETLQIRKSRPEGGKIAETSKEISNTIQTVEKEYGIKPQLPMAVMYNELLKNVSKNLSATSGETVNLERVETILQDALKPFQSTKIPDIPVEGIKKTPSTLQLETGIIGTIPGGRTLEPLELSLSQLHQLRKNIGQQVSDRAFYAKSDANMKMETEVLRDLYRTLGDVIERNLKGKSITVGKSTMDAADYYKGQNNKLKTFMDVRSMLEYQPTEALKAPDAAATLAAMITKAGVYGATAAGASMAGLPINPMGGALVAGGFGAAQAASEAVKSSTPEYLTSIFKTAGKVQSTPLLPEAVTRGTIQYMRGGQPVSNFGREPQSAGLTPKELINYKIPRSTQGIIEQKDKVIAKLVQRGVAPDMVDAVAHALNGGPNKAKNIAMFLLNQSEVNETLSDIFEESEYKVFDGKFLDPNDRARAADEISKRDDIDSIQRARMINRINKFGEVPEGL